MVTFSILIIAIGTLSCARTLYGGIHCTPDGDNDKIFNNKYFLILSSRLFSWWLILYISSVELLSFSHSYFSLRQCLSYNTSH